MLVTWQIQSETDGMVCKSLCAIFIHPAMMLAVTVVRVQRATSIYVFARVHQLVGGFDQSHTQSGGVNRCGLKDTSAWPGALNRQPRRGLTCRFPPRASSRLRSRCISTHSSHLALSTRRPGQSPFHTRHLQFAGDICIRMPIPPR